MTTADLSTRLLIHHYSPDPLDVIAEYTYDARSRELSIDAVVMPVDGAEISVRHHLTRQQLHEIADACREDYHARMESVYDDRRKQQEYDTWAQ